MFLFVEYIVEQEEWDRIFELSKWFLITLFVRFYFHLKKEKEKRRKF